MADGFEPDDAQPHRRRRPAGTPATGHAAPPPLTAVRQIGREKGEWGLGFPGLTAAGFDHPMRADGRWMAIDGQGRLVTAGLFTAQAGDEFRPARRLMGRRPMRVRGGRSWTVFSFGPKERL
jgi:hypothetical protein